MPSEDKEIEVLPGEFTKLMKKAIDDLGISEESISKLKSVRGIKNEGKSWIANPSILLSGTLFLLVVLLPTLFYASARYKSSVTEKILDVYFTYRESSVLDETCIIVASESLQDPFRPPVNCRECAGVTGVHRVRNLSHADFLEKYAFTMQPVLIKDGQEGWTAGKTFSFDFFREMYSEGSTALDKVNEECQFFPYKTEFQNLGEMLNMSRDRVEGKEKPWYVGWSNCDGKAANALRKHYKFPYFLPPELDHSKTDWVFMGLPGYGAHMHIDAVGALSWQAQVRGIKKWILQSPPECGGICISSMEIIVQPGDIIVLDTNKWFHGTMILGNETSIVIGSEYY